MQEVNSVEAIKSAVACNLGVAFVSKLAIDREVKAGQLHALHVEGIPLTRSLQCVVDPARYQSHAVRAFIDLMFDPSAYHPAEPPSPLEAEVPSCLLLFCLLICHVEQRQMPGLFQQQIQIQSLGGTVGSFFFHGR